VYTLHTQRVYIETLHTYTESILSTYTERILFVYVCRGIRLFSGFFSVHTRRLYIHREKNPTYIHRERRTLHTYTEREEPYIHTQREKNPTYIHRERRTLHTNTFYIHRERRILHTNTFYIHRDSTYTECKRSLHTQRKEVFSVCEEFFSLCILYIHREKNPTYTRLCVSRDTVLCESVYLEIHSVEVFSVSYLCVSRDTL